MWTTGRPITSSSSSDELDPNDSIYKVAAIGIKIRRWVTLHGVSLNVNPDMRYFDNIVPCGIRDKKVGTICQFRPQTTVDEVASKLLQQFQRVLGVELVKSNNDHIL